MNEKINSIEIERDDVETKWSLNSNESLHRSSQDEGFIFQSKQCLIILLINKSFHRISSNHQVKNHFN